MKGYTTFKFPYISIEDSKGKLQPIYKEYPKEIPTINLESPVLCCPFSNARRDTRPKKKNLPKAGYCEICYVKFEDYGMHVKCSEHKEYASDDYNYRQIDLFMRELLEEELFGPANHLSSPCERLEARYGTGQQITYNFGSEPDSLIRVSKGSFDDFDDVVEFNVILDNINKNFPSMSK